MFQLTSNAESVFSDLRRDILRTDQNLEQNSRRAAVDAVALVTNRIQQRGEGSDGQRLQTKALLRSGAYSRQHARNRSGRGRRTDQMDFTDTGDLMRGFGVIGVAPGLATTGFLSDEQADKAEYLEAYFGDSFYLSDSEQGIIAEGLVESILDDLNGR